jgi:hypothetical protein
MVTRAAKKRNGALKVAHDEDESEEEAPRCM